MVDFSDARIKMVDGQIRPNDVTSHAVIAAFLKIPRERFVADVDAPLAYLDRDVPLPGSAGRTLTAPMVVARLIQAAAVKADDKVLEVGTTTGYAAAILAELGAKVVALEEDAALAGTASTVLAQVGAAGIRVVTGPLAAGFPAGAPYDVILLNGAVEEIPQTIIDQLADGGRMVTIVGRGKAAQAKVFTKSGSVLSARMIANLTTSPLPGFARKPEFVF